MTKIQDIAGNLVNELGIPAHIKGYHYLVDAISTVSEMEDISQSDMEALHQQVANKFQTTAAYVERAIEHSIEVAWSRGGLIQSLFGDKDEAAKRPTGKDFISILARKVFAEAMP